MRNEKCLSIGLVALLLFSASATAADTALLSMGELIDLELMHHVNSKNTVPGSSLYFRVSEDVVSKGTLLVKAGTVVRGTMADAKKNKAFGRAGKMGIVIGNLKAVDGTSVPLDAEIERKGRTRYGATVGMALTFGLAGLFTRGRAAFLEKGELFSVRVAADRDIDPGVGTADKPSEPAPADLRFSMVPDKRDYVLKIEKRVNIKPIQFEIDASAPSLARLDLVSVNGMQLPEPLSQSSSLTYDGWSLLSYCDEGTSELEFRGEATDGSSVSATSTLSLQIKRKGKRKE